MFSDFSPHTLSISQLNSHNKVQTLFVVIVAIATVHYAIGSVKLVSKGSGNVRATNDIIPMLRKSTTCSCQVTHWLALGDWLQAPNIANLWDSISNRAETMCFSSFRLARSALS